MFKTFRILILSLVLAGVAWSAWQTKQRSVEWKHTLPVNIYFVNGDGSATVEEYLRGLTVADFKAIESFMHDEAARHGRAADASIEIRLGGKVDGLPPEPPRAGSMLEAVAWSLRMRWWAYHNAKTTGPGTQVKLFLRYFDPAQKQRMEHSVGLQKGLIGLVNVFASPAMAEQNNVVTAHEFLHTLGATDKYDPSTNLPAYPQGYAEPERQPLYPQHFAEIMAGRTPLSQSEAVTPARLADVLIGTATAQEINWQ